MLRRNLPKTPSPLRNVTLVEEGGIDDSQFLQKAEALETLFAETSKTHKFASTLQEIIKQVAALKKTEPSTPAWDNKVKELEQWPSKMKKGPFYAENLAEIMDTFLKAAKGLNERVKEKNGPLKENTVNKRSSALTTAANRVPLPKQKSDIRSQVSADKGDLTEERLLFRAQHQTPQLKQLMAFYQLIKEISELKGQEAFDSANVVLYLKELMPYTISGKSGQNMVHTNLNKKIQSINEFATNLKSKYPGTYQKLNSLLTKIIEITSPITQDSPKPSTQSTFAFQ